MVRKTIQRILIPDIGAFLHISFTIQGVKNWYLISLVTDTEISCNGSTRMSRLILEYMLEKNVAGIWQSLIWQTNSV